MQLFVDMDGVLADFDAHHERVFGRRPDKKADNVDWEAVRMTPGFYANIPAMSDMPILWRYVLRYRPIVLTGVPSSVEEAPENKRRWIRQYLGGDVEVRCCRSAEKCLHAQPGDVLIDDWEKYRPKWEASGGVWVTHISARKTIEALGELGL